VCCLARLSSSWKRCQNLHCWRHRLNSRSPRGRIQGSEGKKVRMGQYVRAVDAALRDLLGGRETPLILAAAPPLDAIFRAACSYPHLAGRTIRRVALVAA